MILGIHFYGHVCETVDFAESYNAARSKLTRAEETSALETDCDDECERCRQKWRRIMLSSESESPETNPRTLTKIDNQKKAKRALRLLPLAPPLGASGN